MKKTLIITIAATLTAVAVGAGVLVGCSSDNTSSIPSGDPTVPVATDTQTSAPVETPAAPEVTTPAVGATITTKTEQAAAEAAGLGVYQTSAGTFVVVDPNAPTAQIIIDDAKTTGNGGEPAGTSDAVKAQQSAISVVAQLAYEATGKKLVFIAQRGSYLETGVREGNIAFYVFLAPTAPELAGAQNMPKTSEAATSLAQERIAAQADPSVYEIIDLTK